MGKTSEKVCVVICNWNKVQDLLDCVESVLKSNYSNFDIVVVDNGSEPQHLSEIKKLLPSKVHLIENPINVGGAGGFNLGIQYALNQKIYDSLWILDNDIIVDPDCLSQLIHELRTSEKNGIVGSMILRMDFPDKLQELGAYIDPKECSVNLYMRNYTVSNVKPQPITVDYVPACSLLVDAAKLKNVGLMDQNYFLYFDDADWCVRFKSAGYDIRATPLAKVWHKAGGANKTSSIPIYYYWRNMIHFFLQNVSTQEQMDSYIDHLLIDKVFTALFVSQKTGKINAFKTLLYAVIDGLSGIRGKIKEDKILPLDHNKFGNYFTDSIQDLVIISGDIDKFDSLDAFIKAQKDLKTLNSPRSENTPSYIFLCKHILKEPNPREETFHALGDDVYFIDPFNNLMKGFQIMKEARNEYHELVELFKTDYRDKIRNIINKIMRNPE